MGLLLLVFIDKSFDCYWNQLIKLYESLKNSQCFKNKTRTHMQSFKIWCILRDPNSQTQQQKCMQNSNSLWQKRRTKFIKTILEKLQKITKVLAYILCYYIVNNNRFYEENLFDSLMNYFCLVSLFYMCQVLWYTYFKVINGLYA